MSNFRYLEEYTYDGLLLNKSLKVNDLQAIRNDLELCKGDILTATHSRTGTTWLDEIIHMIRHRGQKDKSQLAYLDKVIFLDIPFPPQTSNVDYAMSRPAPRLLKTHLPLRYFRRNLDKGGEGPKVIVHSRNPKDMLVSFYHFHMSNPSIGFTGTWEEFFQMFKEKRLVYGDFFDFYEDWLQVTDNKNVMFTQYETLQKDTRDEIKKIADFIGVQLTEEELDNVVCLTAFDYMKETFANLYKPMMQDSSLHIKKFIRQGKVGTWRETFTDEQSRFVDERYEASLKPLGMTFDYE